MKMFSSYPGCHEVWSALAEFFRSLNKIRLWWYNIIGDNKGSISYILQIGTITVGSILLTTNLVELKRENNDPILAEKIIEWRKFIGYFGLSIEADPSRVGKNNVYLFHIVFITIPLSVKIHISWQHLRK